MGADASGWFGKTLQRINNPPRYALQKAGVSKGNFFNRALSSVPGGTGLPDTWLSMADYATGEKGHKINNIRDVSTAARHFFQSGMGDKTDETVWRDVAPTAIGFVGGPAYGAGAGALGGFLSEGGKEDNTTGDYISSLSKGISSGLLGSTAGSIYKSLFGGAAGGATEGASQGVSQGGSSMVTDVSGRAQYAGADPNSLSWWERAGQGVASGADKLKTSYQSNPQLWHKAMDQVGSGFWSREQGNPFAGVGTQMAESTIADRQAQHQNKQAKMTEEALVEAFMKLYGGEGEESGLGSLKEGGGIAPGPQSSGDPQRVRDMSLMQTPSWPMLDLLGNSKPRWWDNE